MQQVRNSTLSRALFNVWISIWTLIVLSIFALACLVQAGTINMPDWTKDLRKFDDEEWAQYSAILIISICVLFVLTMVTGIAALRADGY
ncbi:hypothetical protein IWW34DRAFT_738657 [Fusarium oxysporum f. sp. albedinis]|jgi:hypothetical protein|uniref:Uncharacterized protein n=5 Tax=Fusarium oxysporum species complex TaxID=171631 RepID=A0A2H3TPN0_FUSOX|nr:uncharacterized protein FOIG_13519 [Fusarium odoratissimum NRRL 54006]XP_054563125.1 uncharacterized protein FOBCDRAFT_232595 [Fusarium oxysporum Fo47]KAI3579111.1 hypothetical protein IWW34DRAFT_738657 [Fusarium oxysporum f. sp. albedinis]KAI8400255.1 hypothetical protein FOFC_19084 [Fusarium oxysporum]KAK2124812.1 hypothetical protein NOF04DRAFT_13671 [Fusarium oxysporum II5]RKK12336.1 hypothetical protein BFJ65_g14197 [Fusarium oxysporum f. sp. cepae]RYC91311.1 hypothetical protein BFJ6